MKKRRITVLYFAIPAATMRAEEPRMRVLSVHSINRRGEFIDAHFYSLN